MFRRSVKHLYPLEVSAAEKTGNEPVPVEASAEKSVSEATEVVSKWRREAAVAGELRRRLAT